MKDETKGILLGLLSTIAFGLTLPTVRIIVADMEPLFIGLGRAVLAALVAIILLLYFRQKVPNFRQLKQLLWVALGVVVGFPTLSSWAMQYVPASHGGAVLGILPLATAVAGMFIDKEQPSLSFWVISIIGAILVILYTLCQGSGSLYAADIALLLSVILAAIGYAVGARLAKEIGSWQVICWALVLSLPFILAPVLYKAPSSLTNISINTYLSFLYLSLVSQLFAFFLWYKGLALGGTARVSQIQLLQPFITLLASALLLGEIVDTITLLFMGVIICLVWIGKKMPIAEKSTLN